MGYLVKDQVRGLWERCDVPNRIPAQLAASFGTPLDRMGYNTEGGDHSFNGRGAVLMSLAVERQRNPGLSVAELEAAHRAHLHVSHVVWVDKGLADDDQSFRGPVTGRGGRRLYTPLTTGGHVDEFARFVAPSTVLLAEVSPAQRAGSPVAEETHRRLEHARAMLEGQTDQDGTPLTVLRAPTPGDLTLTVGKGDGVFEVLRSLPALALKAADEVELILTASYMNYVVSNGVVLIPRYAKPGRAAAFAETDRRFLELVRGLFSGRAVVQVNPEPVNAGGGGHALHLEQPARTMRAAFQLLCAYGGDGGGTSSGGDRMVRDGGRLCSSAAVLKHSGTAR